MGEISNSKATFYDEYNPDTPITMSLEEKRAPQFEIDRENKKVLIKLKLEAELLSIPKKHKNSPAIDIRAGEMVDRATEDFLHRVYNGMGSDLLGIRGKFKRFFLSNQKYREYVKTFDPKEWQFEVSTELRIKRTGMTYYY